MFLGELEVGVTVMGDSAIIGLDVIHLEVWNLNQYTTCTELALMSMKC